MENSDQIQHYFLNKKNITSIFRNLNECLISVLLKGNKTFKLSKGQDGMGGANSCWEEPQLPLGFWKAEFPSELQGWGTAILRAGVQLELVLDCLQPS